MEDGQDDKAIETFAKKFPDVVLAVIDTKNPEQGFRGYYVENDQVITIT